MDFTTVKFLLQDSKSLLHAFSTRSNYDGILPQAFAQVNKLLQTLTEVRMPFRVANHLYSKNVLSRQQQEKDFNLL